MAKRKAKTSIPRHKRLNRSGRLQAAKHWLQKYQGGNVLQSYKKHFGVDLLCAIVELQMLGVLLDATYVKQVKQSVEGRIKAREKPKQEEKKEEWFMAYPNPDQTLNSDVSEVEEDNDAMPF